MIFGDVALQEVADILGQAGQDGSSRSALAGDEFMLYVKNSNKAEP